MEKILRVALFADTFHVTDGAANVLRRLTDFAKDRIISVSVCSGRRFN